MVVYIEMDGNVKILSPENLYQGSTTNRVTLITPFPSTTAVSVGFILPDGTTVTDSSGSNYFPMELLNTETSAGVTATAYEYVLPFTVLEQYGELKIAFKATFTNGNQTSYLATVEVQESILPTPPENPDEDTYQLLLQYIQTAMQNAANAQSAAEEAQTAAESAETKAAAAETTAGQANETANAANTMAGQANTKADRAVTTSNNAAATASAANQTAIKAKNQASEAQTAATQAQEDADAAAKSASAAETSAREAADSAEEAVITAQGAVSTANEAKTTADGIDGKATQALSNSEQAVTTANEAKELAEQAVAGAGTEVYVNNALQSRLDFTADPQTQIDNIESGTTKVGSAAQADKLAQARNLKVDLASGTAQTFDGSANAEDIGVDGVLPVANGGTGASDLDSVKVGEAGSADEATKLATARNMQVNLASGNPQSFDGSADATEIGVKGILPVANGGTGATSLANITVGRATADGRGNNIENTYSKLSQVVRKDTLVGAMNPTTDAGRNWLANKQLRTIGKVINASGWYRIAEIPNYCEVKFNIFKQFNYGPSEATTITINSGIASHNYVLINVEKSLMVDSSNNYVKQVRFSNNVADTSGYVDVYIEAANPNSYWLSVDICQVYNSNFEIYAFESVTENVTANTTIVNVPKNGGSNTNKPIYQQGSPVLVGYASSVSGTSGSVKLPSVGWYCINYKATSLFQWYSTGVFYWNGNATYLPVSAYLLGSSTLKRAVNISSEGTVTVFDPDSGTSYTDFTVDIYKLA